MNAHALNKPLISAWTEARVICGVLFVLLVLFWLSLPSISSYPNNPEGRFAAPAHNLAVALFLYSNDHDGTYPSGATSTDVFQKLYDGKYLTDPANLLLPKLVRPSVPSTSPLKLPPHYSCWDTVSASDRPLHAKHPDDLPVVISTGIGPLTFQSGSNTTAEYRGNEHR